VAINNATPDVSVITSTRVMIIINRGGGQQV
jgi:hypothetical protein